MLRICSLFILMMASAVHAADRLSIEGAARVIDGDTLEVAGTRVRLFGIDAPERSQTCAGPQGDWDCGRWSGEELTRWIGGRTVRCDGVEWDRYERLVARCDAGQGDLGAAMVQGGAAIAYRAYARDYIYPERAARYRRRGVWHNGGENFTTPAEYRAESRAAQAQPPQRAPAHGACAIKGNVSASGRVYHIPGQRDYERTRIDETRGERWFCTEDEARAAGWRRAAR
nr:thermonuclease family protein [Pararhodobacter zhoushanensis]